MAFDRFRFTQERERIRASSPVSLGSIAAFEELIFGFGSYLFSANLYPKVSPSLQPRGGLSTLKKQTELWTHLNSAGADILPLTIDSNTRLNDYKLATELHQESLIDGKDTLNGYPLLSIPIEQTRESIINQQKPISLRHGTPDARLLVEAALNVGIMEIEGGAISYTLPYSKNYPIEMSLSNWLYIDQLCAFYNQEGIPIVRESFGPLTSTLVPPVISILIQLIELRLALECGVTTFSVSFSQTGNLIQDIAISKSLRELSSWVAFDHLNLEYGNIFLVYHQWMGAFPLERPHADMLLSYANISALLCQVDKIILKTRDEALGVPSLDANADAVKSAKFAREKIGLSKSFMGLPSVHKESQKLIMEVKHLYNLVFSDSSMTSFESVYKAIKSGLLDVPFSPHISNASLLSARRAIDGSIRVFNPGNVPFTDIFLEGEKKILASAGSVDTLDSIVNMILHYASIDDLL